MATIIDITATPLGLPACIADDGTTDNGPALQKIVDYLGCRGGGLVRVPGARLRYRANRLPVIDWWRVGFAGDGSPFCTLSAMNTEHGQGTEMLLGLSRYDASAVRTLTPADFPPLDAVMDSTMAGMFGYRTHAMHHLGFPTGGFAMGPGAPSNPSGNWANSQQLTVEMAFVLYAKGGPNNVYAAACGLTNGRGSQLADPWFLTMKANDDGSGTVEFDFATQEQPNARRGYFGVPAGTLMPGTTHRVTVQIDLSIPRIGIAVDAIWQTVPIQYVPLTQPEHFRKPSGAQFDMGTVGYEEGQAYDTAYCGLRLRSDCPYAWGAPGTAQVRSDGGTITDAWRYSGNCFAAMTLAEQGAVAGVVDQTFTGVSTTAGSPTLTFTDTAGLMIGQLVGHPNLPAGLQVQTMTATTITVNGSATATGASTLTSYVTTGAAMDRRLAWWWGYGGVQGWGYVIGNGQTRGNPTQTGGNFLRGVNIEGGVTVGGLIDFEMDHCNIQGAWAGLLSIDNSLSLYPLTVTSCYFTSYPQFRDTAIRVRNVGNGTILRCHVWPGVRSGIHIVNGELVSIEKIWADDADSDILIRMAGPRNSVDAIYHDDESPNVGGGIQTAMVSQESPDVLLVSGLRPVSMQPGSRMVLPVGSDARVKVDYDSCSKPAGVAW